MATAPKILIVDDQADIGELIRNVAEPMGYAVDVTTSSREAKRLFAALQPDLVILDIVMPDIDGIELLQVFGSAGFKGKILLITGYSSNYLASADKLAKRHGIATLSSMLKPLRIAELRNYLRQTLPPEDPPQNVTTS
ncbi:MAG TPA: response regulator [Candidatus Cybelea sp.]|nr:response regulator [Candidatus Cybelea sp.]